MVPQGIHLKARKSQKPCVGRNTEKEAIACLGQLEMLVLSSCSGADMVGAFEVRHTYGVISRDATGDRS